MDGRATVRVHTGEGRDSDSDLCRDRLNYVWDSCSDTATLRNDHDRFIGDASWGGTATTTAVAATTYPASRTRGMR